MAPRQNPRDLDGWCIPQEGTVRDAIYQLVKLGLRPVDIAAEMKMKGSTVRQHIWAMRHPEQHNRDTNPYVARARAMQRDDAVD